MFDLLFNNVTLALAFLFEAFFGGWCNWIGSL